MIPLTFISILLLLACSTPPDRAVLARVEKEKIRVADLKKIFAEQAEQYGPDLLNDPEGNRTIKKKLLNALIEERLLLQIVREKKIALTPEEEEALMTRIRSGYSRGELEKTLREKKIAMGEWLERQREKKLIEKLLEGEIYSRITPTRKEAEDYYRKYRRWFFEPDRVRCRHIVTNKEEKAKTLLSLLNQGESFDKVARQYSESPDRDRGGDLGFLAAGEYPGVFQAACFTLAVGQTSEIIASPYGFHIFRVVEKKPGRQIPFEEATPAIQRQIRQGKGREELRKWLDDLHRNKKITIDEKALERVSMGGTP